MTLRNFLFLLIALLAIIFVPYVAAYIDKNGDLSEYFYFPPTSFPDKDPYHIVVVICVGIVVLVLVLLYLVPRLFGFRKPPDPVIKTLTTSVLPPWFWVGLIAWAIALIALAAKWEEPKWLINWALLPLFWGFTLMLDGLVYYINGRSSMLKDNPTELFAMALASISGWLIFEYLNFFIRLNWYYPRAKLVGHDEFLLYAVLGSSAFIPMSFEWYQLLRKVKILNEKYKYGPKLRFPRWLNIVLLLLFLVALFVTPFKDDKMFYMVWIAPLFIIAIVLTLLGIWTPFRPIAKEGNWTPLLLFGLTFLIQGFLMECWNYLSVTYISRNPDVFETNNPAFWRYCIPYVHKGLIFEMPVLGYAGYLFFSIHCWLWWLAMAKMMGIDTKFSLQPDFR